MREEGLLERKFVSGMRGIGLLALDGEWHNCTLLKRIGSKFEVKFVEYGNIEVVGKDSFFLLDDVIDDDDDDDDIRLSKRETGVRMGKCEMCLRHMPLTFHHLIPRETHSKYIKKSVYTKDYLDHHGVDICRPCHNVIHR